MRKKKLNEMDSKSKNKKDEKIGLKCTVQIIL